MTTVNKQKNLDAECIEKLCNFINNSRFLYIRNNMALMENIFIYTDKGNVFSLHNKGKSQVLLYTIPKKYLHKVSVALVRRVAAIGTAGRPQIGSPKWVELRYDYAERLDAKVECFKSSLPKNPALTLMKLLEHQK